MKMVIDGMEGVMTGWNRQGFQKYPVLPSVVKQVQRKIITTASSKKTILYLFVLHQRKILKL